MAWFRAMGGGSDSNKLQFPPSAKWSASGTGNFTINDSMMSVQYLTYGNTCVFTYAGTAEAAKTLTIQIVTSGGGEGCWAYARINNVDTSQTRIYANTTNTFTASVSAGDTFAIKLSSSWASSNNATFSIIYIG